MLVPDAHGRAPRFVQRHALTLLSVSPDVRDLIPVPAELARSLEFSREGNSPVFTRRLAHGLVDFLLGHAAWTDSPRCDIWLDNVDAADALDREFVAVLLRRAAPEVIRVTVATRSEAVGEPLLAALLAHARVTRLASEAPPDLDQLVTEPPARQRSLAEAYVTSDCTSDDLLARRAYERSSATLRGQLHLERAASLRATRSRALALGAIPFHCERSARPEVEPFLAASAYCMRMGYYEASLDLARRGARLLEAQAPDERLGSLRRNVLFSLLLLGRLDEVEGLCNEVEASASDPALRSHCAYAMGILNARLYPQARRDYPAARAWIEKAIALAQLLPASDTRVVNEVFLQNTLALVETRTGHPERALELLEGGLARLQAEAPSRYVMESVILLHNRARVHVILGDPERALQDYTTLLLHEPSNSEAHLDRGNLLQSLGRHQQALEDCDAAIAWSPPYAEAYFNRAQTLCALGRTAEALADFDRVLTLEPEDLGALIGRAGVLYDTREPAAARTDVDRALALDPRHAKACCLLGLLEMEQQRWEQAGRAFDRALASDDSEVAAWINRATLLFRGGDPEAALRDLGEALRRREDLAARYNRGRILQSLRRWHEAIADYERALELSSGGLRDAARQRDLCRRAQLVEALGET